MAAFGALIACCVFVPIFLGEGHIVSIHQKPIKAAVKKEGVNAYPAL